MGQGQVAIEPLLLLGKRGVLPVAVQAGLADGDDPGHGRQVDDARPVVGAGLGHMVGLNADRGEDAMMAPAISHPALSAAVVPMATI